MFQFLAGMLAFFYGLIPNYAVAIALLTLTVMLVLSPLTLKSTRSMLAMQRLQPEVKRIQQKYKGGDRQQMNQEMMALYKEHQVNPVSGCLPMLVQLPVLFIMYHVIRGLSEGRGDPCSPEGPPGPKYLDSASHLFKDLCESGREMVSFGIDLSKTATDAFEQSVATGLPFLLLVGLVIFVQYYQSRQMTRRNPQATASPQMQMVTKVMPVMFGVFSFAFPAALNVYFIISGLFRIGQQGAMYRWDPTLKAHVKERAKASDAKATDGKGSRSDGKKAPPRSKDRDAKRDAKASPGQRKSDGKRPADKSGPKAQTKGSANGKTQNGRRPNSSKKSRGGERGRARKRRAKRGR